MKKEIIFEILDRKLNDYFDKGNLKDLLALREGVYKIVEDVLVEFNCIVRNGDKIFVNRDNNRIYVSCYSIATDRIAKLF